LRQNKRIYVTVQSIHQKCKKGDKEIRKIWRLFIANLLLQITKCKFEMLNAKFAIYNEFIPLFP